MFYVALSAAIIGFTMYTLDLDYDSTKTKDKTLIRTKLTKPKGTWRFSYNKKTSPAENDKEVINTTTLSWKSPLDSFFPSKE